MTQDQLRAAIAKLDEDIAWRGPGGRVAAYVVLPRNLAIAVREQFGNLPEVIVAERLPG